MLKSMTGFGKSNCQVGNTSLLVEIKALNGKNLDISIKIPSFFREKEQYIRQLVSENLTRGKIDVFISTERGEGSNRAFLNKTLFKYYYRDLEGVANEIGLELGHDIVAAIARIPEVFSFDCAVEDIEAVWPVLSKSIYEATERLNEFRVSEGAHLHAELKKRVNILRELSDSITPLEAERWESLKNRLQKNLEELSEAGRPDPGRFEQELIYYLEKLDITEEKVRLEKHIQYFEDTMENEENPGKKLGFIGQEIGREINTLGSKANHAEMQKFVIMMKDELEKIKEQLMNVL